MEGQYRKKILLYWEKCSLEKLFLFLSSMSVSNSENSLSTTNVAWKRTLASQMAGIVGCGLLHPLDVIRTRWMSQDFTKERQHNGTSYRGFLDAGRHILKMEGPRALLRGVHVACLGSAMAWGTYMCCYQFLGRWYVSIFSSSDDSGRTNGQHAKRWVSFFLPYAFSCCSSVTSAVICNPIWLLKTRLQLAEGVGRQSSSSVLASTKNFYSLREAVVYTARTTGVLSFWRGTSAQVLLSVPHAISFPLYEFLQNQLQHRYYHRREYGCFSGLYSAAQEKGGNSFTPSAGDVLLCSSVSKAVTCVLSNPILLVKIRLQDYRAREGIVQYTSFCQTMRTGVALNGWKAGLFRGLTASLMHTVPRSCLFYLLYENIFKILST